MESIIECIANRVDWECIAPQHLPYSGHRRAREEVRRLVADIAAVEEIRNVEPREFIEAGENVTVLEEESAVVKESGRSFESQWVHVFTVRNGQIVRWRGFSDTAAREG